MKFIDIGHLLLTDTTEHYLHPRSSFVSMSQPWDYIAKLVCIGDSGTGKSSVSVSHSFTRLLY